jgi:K+-sensing histidine kinase KdpD
MPGAPRTNPAAPRGAQADLAARLRQAAEGLQDRLNRRDTLIELIRSVNATLDPRKVADALLAQVHGWFPTTCLVIAVQDGSQRASLIAERGPCEEYSDGLERVARWITEHNEEFMSASLATDARLPDFRCGAVRARLAR